jgi:hypothetical protein
MPLPMVHLAIAVRLVVGKSVASRPEFYLGSLAPDAIHMRDGTDRADKLRTHLRVQWNPPDPTDIHALLVSYQHCPEPLPSFTMGYAAHLLADRLWKTTILAWLEQVTPELDRTARDKLYYLETDQVDFNLYRRMEWREDVWRQLAQATAPDLSPLLSADEISRWRDHTLHWFGELMQDPNIEPQYITDHLVDDFIEQAVRQVDQTFAAWQNPESG